MQMIHPRGGRPLVPGVILASGWSQRMGRAKALLPAGPGGASFVRTLGGDHQGCFDVYSATARMIARHHPAAPPSAGEASRPVDRARRWTTRTSRRGRCGTRSTPSARWAARRRLSTREVQLYLSLAIRLGATGVQRRRPPRVLRDVRVRRAVPRERPGRARRHKGRAAGSAGAGEYDAERDPAGVGDARGVRLAAAEGRHGRVATSAGRDRVIRRPPATSPRVTRRETVSRPTEELRTPVRSLHPGI